MSEISICIPTINKRNDNGDRYVDVLVDSLVRTSSGYIDFEIIIEEENRSFPNAINTMVEKASADVLILNDDMICEYENWDMEILEHCVGDIMGFKLHLLRNTTEIPILQHGGGSIRLDKRGMNDGLDKFDLGQFDFIRACPFVTFTSVFIRKCIFDKVGLLDEDLGRMYFEDVDWCLRAWEKDIPVIFNPEPYFFHLEGASVGEDNITKISEKSRYNFNRKWMKTGRMFEAMKKVKEYNAYLSRLWKERIELRE